MRRKIPALIIGFLALLIVSCNSNYTPRPRGYFAISFPTHQYQLFNRQGFPYSFEYPVYSRIIRDSSYFDPSQDSAYSVNVDIPSFNARIYLSYKTIGGKSVYRLKTDHGFKDSTSLNTFDNLRDDAYKITFKHTAKATSIEDSAFVTPNGIGGIFFNGGNAATGKQFLLPTLLSFSRGALYFNDTPNEDSYTLFTIFCKKIWNI